MISRKFKIYTTSAMIISMLATVFIPISANAANANQTIQTASDNAYSWLKTQQDATYNQKIVDSFEDYYSDGTRIPISYTYDQACAAIAFLLKGDTTRAVKVLDVLKSLQIPQTDSEVRNRGAWCNSYFNDEQSYLYGQELRLHVGVAMWVCMAIMEYEKVTGDTTTYHTMATNAIDWALLFQKSNGGISGGRTTWDSGDGSWTDEVWTSTEHNEDAYAVLSYFANNTPDKAAEYTAAANSVKNFLDTVVWDNANQRFYGGYKNDTQTIDPQIPMDVNPWGVLSLGLDGTHTYSNALDYVENANGNPGTLANPKYKQTLVYDGVNTMTGYDFDWEDDGVDASSSSGGGTLGKDIWFEGSAFMSDAYYLRGDTAKADEILLELAKKQSTGADSYLGGIPYSLMGTNNNYWHMSSSNCVSSTAWFIIAAERFNPFNATQMSNSTSTQVAAPSFSLASGTYTGTQNVTISSATSGATIYYTLDGTTPTTSSTVYSGPVSIESTKTLKAIAVYSGMTNSAVSTATYTIDTSGISTKTNGVSVNGTTETIWFEPPTTATSVDLHYTINGGTQQNFAMTYNSVTGRWEKTINVASGDVINYSFTYVSGLAYDTSTFSYTVGESLTQVAAPTFSLATGTYTGAQSVTISSQTSGAAIYYTLDGTTPTTSSTVYSGPISIESTKTLKAIAVCSSMTNSEVSTATYTISTSTENTNGVSVNGTTATIWFKPATTSVWCDVHYAVNGGGQQNFRMTYNDTTGKWEQPITNIATGDVINYFITYEKDGLAYDSAWYTYTV